MSRHESGITSPEVAPSETALSRTIADVQQNGDVFDRVKWFRRNEHLSDIALLGAGIAGFQIGKDVDPISLTSGMMVWTGSAIATSATRPFARKYHRRKIEPLLQSYAEVSTEYGGDSLEVYRERTLNGPKIHVVWEPQEPEPSKDRTLSVLERLAQETAHTKVATISVPRTSIKDHLEENADLVTITDRDVWLAKPRRPREIRDIKNEDDPLCSFTPAQLNEFIDRIKPKEDRSPLEVYMDLLAQVRRQHPSLRFYNQTALQTAAGKRKLTHSLANHISAKLSDTDVRSVADEVSGVRHKEKIHKIGRLPVQQKNRRPYVQWNLTNGAPLGETEDLLRYFGLSPKDLERLPENIKKMRPSQAATACEIGAYLVLQDALDNPPTASIPRTRAVIPPHASPITEHSRGMQVRIAEHVLVRKPAPDAARKTGLRLRHMRSRTLASVALASVAFSGGIAASTAMGGYMYYKAENNPKLDMDNIPKSADPIKEYDQELHSMGPLMNASLAIDDKRYALKAFTQGQLEKLVSLQHLAPDEIKQRQDKLYKERTQDYVGNVQRGKNQPSWFISSYGGMPSEGLWSEASSNRLSTRGTISWTRYDLDQQFGESYELIEKVAREAPYLPTPDAVDTAQPRLRVQRDLTTNLFGTYLANAGGSEQTGDFVVFEVPVLAKTRIVAAQFNDGAKVKTITLKNGQQVILAPRIFSDMGKLEYWLAPDDKKRISAVGPIEDEWREKSLVPVSSPWKTILPGSLAQGGLAQVRAQQNYIQNTFQYRLQPIKGKLPTKLNTYVEGVLDSKVANCNTANTLLLVSNPQDLNGVNGYMNKNTSEQVKTNKMHLSTSEGHFWTVDKKGAVHDATPGNGLTAEDAAFFEENFADGYTNPAEQRKRMIIGAGGLLGILALTGIGYKARRPIKRGVKAITAKRAHKKLAALPEADIQLAHATANHLIYAEKPLSAERLDAIKNRLTANTAFNLDKDASLDEQWAFTVKHSARKDLRKSRPVYDSKEVKRAVRLARKTYRLIERTNR